MGIIVLVCFVKTNAFPLRESTVELYSYKNNWVFSLESRPIPSDHIYIFI